MPGRGRRRRCDRGGEGRAYGSLATASLEAACSGSADEEERSEVIWTPVSVNENNTAPRAAHRRRRHRDEEKAGSDYGKVVTGFQDNICFDLASRVEFSTMDHTQISVSTTYAAHKAARRQRRLRGKGSQRQSRTLAVIAAATADATKCPTSSSFQIPSSQNASQQQKNPTMLVLPNTSLDLRNCRNDAFGHWGNSLWTPEQLDFESDFTSTHSPRSDLSFSCESSDDPRQWGYRLKHRDKPHGILKRVLTEKYGNDPRLWAYLLDYRKRVYGMEGVMMIWNEMRKRPNLLPAWGGLSDIMWMSFLALGFHHPRVLEEIIEYARTALAETKSSWHGLYTYIVEYFLVRGESDAALQWHKRLFNDFPPGAYRFSRLCREVIRRGGDMDTLMRIHQKTSYVSLYGRIVRPLCFRGDFKAALRWHWYLVKRGDLPASAQVVQPLVHHCAIYYPHQAKEITKSLVAANVSFAPSIKTQVEETDAVFSREQMNLAHGETLGVSAKKYNDSFGSRWFASTWVSLDTAINAVHALGVQEIGPLSLQAIALREPNAASIMKRINQMQSLGISLGDSLFCKCVKYFAYTERPIELEGLIKSDQHPDELENSQLQESLLALYAQSKEWANYRRTLSILLFASRFPKIHGSNIILRSLIVRGNMTAIYNHLEDMQLKNTPVTVKTIVQLLAKILHFRQRGKLPRHRMRESNRQASNDLNIAIALLKRLMHTGSFVPVLQWREILRRLGMVGRFEDFSRLAFYLATWYGPSRGGMEHRARNPMYHIPTQVPTSHGLHPLGMLFSRSLQAAIVDWGFIFAQQRRTKFASHQGDSASMSATDVLPDLACGLRLLKDLNGLGVHIHSIVVRNAIMNRLITYFGPGKSAKIYNRNRQNLLSGRLDEVASMIDEALGGVYFSSPHIDLQKMVMERATKKMMNTTTNRLKRKIGRTRDPLLLGLGHRARRLRAALLE